MAEGALSVGGVADRTFWKIPDRATAINTAIGTLTGKDDVVGIFGKGHEKSMNIGGVEYPWSDETAARNALKVRSKR
jgi:UDP-N-acetylmuramyl tripeptide synthase